MIFNHVEKAVFVGAHTDDEMVCAGTLRKLVKGGVNVTVIAFSRARIDGIPVEESSPILDGEFRKSMETIGAQGRIVGLETRALPESATEIRQSLYDFVEEERPDMCFVLSPLDEHQDHRVIGEESERVMRGRVPVILQCRFPWSHQAFEPDTFVSLTDDELAAKIAVARSYQSQLYRYQYPEMFKAFARGDGLSVKHDFAEKFHLVRCIV